MSGYLNKSEPKGEQDVTKVTSSCLTVNSIGEEQMHLSTNQMAEWIHHEDESLTQDQLIDEYFSCIIDCTDNFCRKVCTEILK